MIHSFIYRFVPQELAHGLQFLRDELITIVPRYHMMPRFEIVSQLNNVIL